MSELPVIDITWDQASAACKIIGGQLPNEIQWEIASKQWFERELMDRPHFIQGMNKLIHEVRQLQTRYSKHGPDDYCLMGELNRHYLNEMDSPQRFYVGAIGEWCEDVFSERIHPRIATEGSHTLSDNELDQGFSLNGIRTVRGAAESCDQGWVRIGWEASQPYPAGFRCVWSSETAHVVDG